jgi:hypothetical protein
MKEYKINGWNDFWNIFGELIDLLNTNNQSNVALEFQESKKYVNGLTDGWFDFLMAFKNIVKLNLDNLTEEQMYIANLLITTLNKILTNR